MNPPEDCRRCSLCEGRSRVVRPDGDPSSPIALVGEAPGAEEDKLGRPFVGRSGKVLTKILEEGGLPRSRVFITNTVKCRPPNNRPPTAAEMEACWPCLEEELKDRKVIITLGRSAAKDLLKRDISMAAEANRPTKVVIRGKEIDLIPAYHPAASFYNSTVMDSLRETVRLARTYL
ncbi:uracil-DNA glycosylase [Methanomassiliicoccus luminyensis]|jgi:uracil-DNA glycosylase family 4|uniref:uracil-DNA glycosylase n=1 Tax=Methanomassiliicoccus luminyensis TaxID=1080712 RepID=UPI0003696AFE|nr:uracil-DNA glycosylase [Methanomassiliicoccus luminyensis]